MSVYKPLEPYIITKISHLDSDILSLTECGKVMFINLHDSIINFVEIDISLSGNKIIDICSGLRHSLLLCDNGTVYSFGKNDSKQTGHNNNGSDIGNPMLIPNLYNVVQIVCCDHHSLVLTKDGLVYGFGDNTNYQLGFNNPNLNFCPTLISELKDIIQISMGSYHTLALKNDGKIYGFGTNYNGQLGCFEYENISVPTPIKSVENIREIRVSNCKSFFIMKNGDILQMFYNKMIPRGSIYA
jgi:alpha-tubulin suppressor-like RCC1 family protein